VRSANLTSDVELVQCHERPIEDTRIVCSLLDRGWLPLQAQQRVDGNLCRGNRVLNGEHHILRQLAELTNERHILPALRADLRSVALLARQKLTGTRSKPPQ
jgi:hypothetical protein